MKPPSEQPQRRSPARVVKVGGSLFSFPRLGPALREWLAEQPPAANILLAGGGPFAEAIREADARFQLGEERSHWLCVAALELSARLLAELLPACRLVSTCAALQQEIATARPGPLVWAPAVYLREEDQLHPEGALPHTWAVTSDSIAARVARVVGADELVLLKSADPPEGDWTQAGYVDGYFRHAARHIPRVRCVNLCRYVG